MKTRIQIALVISLVANAILLFLWLNARAPAAQVAQLPDASAAAASVTPGSTQAVAATSTAPASATPTASTTPSPTAIPTATATATATASATATATATPTPSATIPPSPTPVPMPAWLSYLNLFREQANLPPLVENQAWSEGSRLHSVYMVMTDDITHDEGSYSPWYTQAGFDAGKNGNIAATPWEEATDTWAINYWMTAPFHGLPILDPQLESVGFGFHTGPDPYYVAAGTMNVLFGLSPDPPPDTIYPLPYPRDGGETWLRSSSLYEWPEPLSSCPGYEYPVGAPIYLQVGTGRRYPAVEYTSLQAGVRPVDHCVLTEMTYTNPDASAQASGRAVLAARDAIVLIPREKLEVGQTYTVTVIVDGQNVTWSFAVVHPPE